MKCSYKMLPCVINSEAEIVLILILFLKISSIFWAPMFLQNCSYKKSVCMHYTQTNTQKQTHTYTHHKSFMFLFVDVTEDTAVHGKQSRRTHWIMIMIMVIMIKVIMIKVIMIKVIMIKVMMIMVMMIMVMIKASFHGANFFACKFFVYTTYHYTHTSGPLWTVPIKQE